MSSCANSVTIIISPTIVTVKYTNKKSKLNIHPKDISIHQRQLPKIYPCTYSTRVSLLQQVVFRVRKRIEVLQRRYPPHLCSWHKTYHQPRQILQHMCLHRIKPKSLDLTGILHKTIIPPSGTAEVYRILPASCSAERGIQLRRRARGKKG